MKLPWKRDDQPPKNLVLSRAAVVPKHYRVDVQGPSVENNLTVNSISTQFVTVQPLAPGESAQSVMQAMGSDLISEEEQKRRHWQRISFNAPNWVEPLVRTVGGLEFPPIDLPVWIDPATMKIDRVDVEQFLTEVEPMRERAQKIWGQELGAFADVHQILAAPKVIAQGAKEVVKLPKHFLGAIKDLVADIKSENVAPPEKPPAERPDLSQHPPVNGVDYDTWVLISVKPQLLAERGIDPAEWNIAHRTWLARIAGNATLGAAYVYDVDRLRREG